MEKRKNIPHARSSGPQAPEPAALRLSEERYRIAGELAHALIWEADIPSRTLTLSEEAAAALDCPRRVFPDAPESILAPGRIGADSRKELRQLFEDIYAGQERGERTILLGDGKGGGVWLHASFRLVRGQDDAPLRAVGVVEKLPNLSREMKVFQDELKVSDSISSSALGVARIDLTRDAVEAFTVPLSVHTSVFSRLRKAGLRAVHPSDAGRVDEATRPEKLIRDCRADNNWSFLEFRGPDRDGEPLWISLAINLMRHPVSGDIYAFGYFRDVTVRHRWLTAMQAPPRQDTATLLFTKDSLAELARIAVDQMPEGARCALTVFEINGFDRMKSQCGVLSAQNLLFTVGRLCRIMIDGEVASGHFEETQFAVFRVGVASPEQQRVEVERYKNRARLLLEQTMLDVNVDISCGFAMSGRQDFRFDELLRRAVLACRMGREAPGNPVTEYADPCDYLHGTQSLPAHGRSEEKHRILIADDDTISRALLRTILEQEYLVDEAGDGDEALTLLRLRQYALLLCDIQMPRKNGWEVLAAMQAEKMLLRTAVIMVTADGAQESEVRALNLGAVDVIVKPIVPEVLMSRARNIIGRQEAAAALERNSLYELRFQQQADLLRRAEYDTLTGLFNKQGFFRAVRERLDARPGEKFRLVRWDLDNFKMVNDTMGMDVGDRLLRDIGGALHDVREPEVVFSHLEADHFVIFLPESLRSPQDILGAIQHWIRSYPFNFRLTVHMGVYPIDDPAVEVSVMCDRALLALKSVKGSFTNRIGWYDASLRSTILEEQELSGEMVSALEHGQFILYFQPQVNYDSGALIGAEVLVRWQHPTKGLISPAKFIPLFERNGFISTLDEYVWEQSCLYMRKWLDQKGKLLPVSVSVNISRVDIYNPKLCEYLEGLVKRYDLPPEYLRLEITESAYMQNPDQLIAVVRELRKCGFTVEMDDFGAGYSSLNTLKDVPVNVLKLDIRFLSGGEDNARGGNILSSVIRMAHWLDMPVIAEGVETRTQADYLKGLNCFYMQGYYFGKPMPAAQFEELLSVREIGETNRFGTSELTGVAAFWDPSTQTALLFNSLVDGAAIMEYQNGNAEILRANDKFYDQLGTTREAYWEKQKHTLLRFDPEERETYVAMLEEAIRTGDEAACEIRSLPLSPGGTPFWTHSRVRLLAKNADGYLFYLAVENITARKKIEEQARVSREALQLAVSQTGKMICLYDIPSRVLTVPEEYSKKHGVPTRIEGVPHESPGASLLIRDWDRYYNFYRQILEGKPHCSARVRFGSAGRGYTWEQYESTTVFDGAGKPLRAVISAEDVTVQMEREAESERARLLLAREGTCIFDYDVQSDLLTLQIHPPGADVQDETVADFTHRLGRSARIPSDSARMLLYSLKSASRVPGTGELEFRGDLWGTGQRWCRMRYVGLSDETGTVYRFIGQAEDIDIERSREDLDRRITALLGEDGTGNYDFVLPERTLALLYGARDGAAALSRVLEAAGFYFGADRAYVFEDFDAHRRCCNTFELCAADIASRQAALQDCVYPLKNGENTCLSLFDTQDVFYCPDASARTDLPPDAFGAEHTGTVLRFAIRSGGRRSGFIGFEREGAPREWTPEERTTLMIVSRLIATYLPRWRNEKMHGLPPVGPA